MSPTNAVLLLCRLAAAAGVHAQVPADKTFRFVNDGELHDLFNEYGATYRIVGIDVPNFMLMLYNTTPSSFVLAYRMGSLSVSSDSGRFWVWEANRKRPVGEGATVTFGTDGNLVLADADGTVAWSTGTANKGVVAINATLDGNLALVDKNGKAVWQSFDHPTDTLLNGQSLSLTTTSRLVSRKSVENDVDGAYSWSMQSNSLVFSVDASPAPIQYGAISFSRALTKVTFVCQGRTLKLLTNTGTSYNLGTSRTSCRYSFLRLGIDGNLIVQVYDDVGDAWNRTFSYFLGSRACGLPTKCGALGVCQSGRCASCPTAAGLVPWSSTCAPPSRGPCGSSPSAYYRVAGVEHFVSKFSPGVGKVAATECESRCSRDCKCLGYFVLGGHRQVLAYLRARNLHQSLVGVSRSLHQTELNKISGLLNYMRACI